MYGRHRPERKACKSILPEDVFRPRGFKRPAFDFHYDGAGFQGMDGVPLADGDVQGDYLAAGREFIRIYGKKYKDCFLITTDLLRVKQAAIFQKKLESANQNSSCHEKNRVYVLDCLISLFFNTSGYLEMHPNILSI